MKARVVAIQFENCSYVALKALDAIMLGPMYYYDKNTLTIEEENALMEEFIRLYPDYKHWHLKILTDAQPLDFISCHCHIVNVND